jgi:hypothetical protein
MNATKARERKRAAAVVLQRLVRVVQEDGWPYNFRCPDCGWIGLDLDGPHDAQEQHDRHHSKQGTRCHPNSELSSERAAEPQPETGADARRLLK